MNMKRTIRMLALLAFWGGLSRLPAQEEFLDEFAEPDGPPSYWTPYQGDWKIESEVLSGEDHAAGLEAWIWLNETFGGDISIEFNIEWQDTQVDGVGRHGGMAFLGNFAGAPQTRYQMSGYTLDWIDRASDHGIRMHRWDNGVESVLLPDLTFTGPDPPEKWKVVISGEKIS